MRRSRGTVEPCSGGWPDMARRIAVRAIAVAAPAALSAMLAAVPAQAQEDPAPAPAPQSQAPLDWTVYSPISLRNDSNWLTFANGPSLNETQPGLHFTADQQAVYNDNVLLLPKDAVPTPGFSRGDWASVTSLAAMQRFQLGAQSFFVRGTFGATRYAEDTGLNATRYSGEGGVDWIFTSRCAGRLIGSFRRTQANLDQVTSTETNNIDISSFQETAKCAVSEHINLILDTSYTRSMNSQASLAANDFDQRYLRGGVEYEFALLHAVGIRGTFTDTDFIGRSPTITPGLSTSLDQSSYEVYYRRIFSPKLDFEGAIGITDSKSFSALHGTSSFSTTTYSARLKWQATPKVGFVLSGSSQVLPPIGVVADYQQRQDANLAAMYLFSPKLSFTGFLGISKQENPVISGIGQSTLADQIIKYAMIRAIYQISPMLHASADYRYTHRKDESTGNAAVANIYMLGITYQR